MKSSSFGLGVNEADVQLFMNVTYYKFGSSHENFVVGLDLSHDKPGAPNKNIVQNHINITLLNICPGLSF